MSVNSFKFVSPGVFVNEVDNSQLARLPDTTGPVIIGRAERGPAMVPVKVESFAEFVEIFGEPIAGAQASDVWRQGNRLAPTYGAFAAQAYLKNAAPITFVRLLGQAHPDAATDDAKAGWKMPAAYALKVQDANAQDKLAAIIYSTGQKAQPTGATVANGNVTVHIPVADSAAAAGSAASSKLTISDFTDAQDDTFTLTHQDGTTVRTVAFDNTTSVSSFAATTLTVGTLDITTANELAERIASEVNKLGTNLKVTAYAAANVITFICDDLGEMGNNVLDIIAVNAANAAGIAKSDFVDGSNVVQGQTAEETFVVNFDSNSRKYIRKVLNTNPTATNTRDSMATENYFLGQSFDQFVNSELGTITGASLVPLHSVAGASYGDYLADAKHSKTPWVLSQFMGDFAGKKNSSHLQADELTKLFRIHSLYAGEWEQKNFKISITDIKPSDRFNAYGSFTVLVRDTQDSDATMVVRERFSNCNLDPNSADYIGAKIGDMQQIWEEEERRYRTVGAHPNMSKYMRVEVATSIETGEANAELIPFGFSAPAHAATAGIAAGEMPKFRFRTATAADVELSSPRDAFFGISTGEISQDANGNNVETNTFDKSYQDLVKGFSAAEDVYGTAGELFSLDLITATGTNDATFAAASNSSDTVKTGTSINAAAEGTEPVLDAGFDSFTLPLAGGLDGLNIVEVEPFCDNIMLDMTALSSAPFNTISKAIDMVSDPEVVECNLMAIPGVSTRALTGKLITVCERRGDALAIIDLEDDYVPNGWTSPTTLEKDRLPKVDAAISKLKNRALSSSYGCAFYPWVQVNDQINNRLVWMPPSVVALGTMASSAASSELWFAPAGFTRGGLSNGAGGVPVSQVRLRLNSKQRDKLYEANINPIAQFPAEGIVVFGQKTLQMTPSALDRINVRRLMIHVKKEISRMAATVLFDQNVNTTWARFLAKADPFLASVKSRFGLSEYRVILDETTTTPELVDRNIVYAKVFLKPARAIEFIAVDFVITNSGASFDD